MARKNNIKEYSAWQSMMYRCSSRNKKLKAASYVRRGITVSEELKSFKVFLEHVGSAPSPSHQLDRIDNNRGYEKGNLRWATPEENANNRSDNRIYEYQGKMLRLIEIKPLLQCGVNTFLSRVQRGWKVEDAIKRGDFLDRKIGELIEFDGKSLTLCQWAEYMDIPVSTLYCRLNKLGWSIEKALTSKSKKN
jgi:hypothetical protein